MAEQSLPAGVALTAVLMAREREVETARAGGLLDDPWARGLVEAAAASFPAAVDREAWVAQRRTLGEIAPMMTGYVPLRTRWIDDAALAAVRDGAAQVVLLGAGLDTRALRLDWPRPVPVYTVDQPEVVAFTGHALAGAAPRTAGIRVVPVGVDLAGPWAGDLVAAGFDPGAPTFWLVEGLLPYLTPAEGGALLEAVRDLSGPGAGLVGDVILPAAERSEGYAAGRRGLVDNGSPLTGAIADPASWLAEHGWAGGPVDVPALAAGLGAALPPCLDAGAVDGEMFAFVSATPAR